MSASNHTSEQQVIRDRMLTPNTVSLLQTCSSLYYQAALSGVPAHSPAGCAALSEAAAAELVSSALHIAQNCSTLRSSSSSSSSSSNGSSSIDSEAYALWLRDRIAVCTTAGADAADSDSSSTVDSVNAR
jgi:hypothetical protein